MTQVVYGDRDFLRAPCYRLIPSKYPPIDLFDDVASPDEFDAVFLIQAQTNPRLRDALGAIERVPPAEWQLGVTGAGYIMAAFAHVNPDGSRFSDGSYGIYYAAREVETAIAETVYHLSRFYRATHEPAQAVDMRALRGDFSACLLDASNDAAALAPDSYGHSQPLGMRVRREGRDGVVYPSVRRARGECYALMRPKTLHQVVQAAHYRYAWTGQAFEVYLQTATNLAACE